MAAQEREASNFNIQSVVADSLSLGLKQLYGARRVMDFKFKILLAIHDAVLLEVPYCEVSGVTELLKENLCPIIPGTKFKYDIDVSVSEKWGEKGLSPEVAKIIGECDE